MQLDNYGPNYCPPHLKAYNDKASKRLKWDLRFLDLAKLVSTWSKDPSTQVGAVIADQSEVVSVGFNGFPQKMHDSPELYASRDEKYSRIIHGEVNALLFAKQKLFNATLYTYPFLPCDRCAVLMLQAGITRFVAPKADAGQLERWGTAFERTRRYIQECGASYLEIDFNG